MEAKILNTYLLCFLPSNRGHPDKMSASEVGEGGHGKKSGRSKGGSVNFIV